MTTITKDSSIQDIVTECPESVEVFAQYGLGCIGCAMASYETLEQGAAAHGINIDELLKALNEKADSSKGSTDCGCGCG